MILPIILIILSITTFIMIFVLDEEYLKLFSALLFLIIISPLTILSTSHTNELALIRKGQPLINIREQAIKDIDKQLSQIRITNSALMNADSPVRSLVETKAKFISELTEQKIKIEQARINIEGRSIGMMRMIVGIYGKE